MDINIIISIEKFICRYMRIIIINDLLCGVHCIRVHMMMMMTMITHVLNKRATSVAIFYNI